MPDLFYLLISLLFYILYKRLGTARKKIKKIKGLEPTEFEDTATHVEIHPTFLFLSIYADCWYLDSSSRPCFDLENGNQEMKSDLKDLYINSAMCVL